MAKRKFQITGFARFLLFLVIAAPLAYLGASYYNGENGIENIKNMISDGQKSTPSASAEAPASKLEEALTKIEKLEKENKKLKKELEEAERTIQKLKH